LKYEETGAGDRNVRGAGRRLESARSGIRAYPRRHGARVNVFELDAFSLKTGRVDVRHVVRGNVDRRAEGLQRG